MQRYILTLRHVATGKRSIIFGTANTEQALFAEFMQGHAEGEYVMDNSRWATARDVHFIEEHTGKDFP